MTADALHVNGETMDMVREKNGHLLVGLKGNQEKALDKVKNQFALAEHEKEPMARNFSENYGHGRIETRLAEIMPFSIPSFPHIQTAVRMTRTRMEKRRGFPNGKYSEEVSYYVATFPMGKYTPEEINNLIRGHWAVENKLHHVKDRTMKEDRYKAKDAVAANVALIRSCIVTLKQRFRKQGILAKSLRGHVIKAVEVLCKPLVKMGLGE
jgi:predicted transposase YbfD/YdcC